MRLRAVVGGTDARVVPAIERAVGEVPLGIIKSAPRLAVLAFCRRLAAPEASRPGAVMSLQKQSIVRLVRSQLEQLVRQFAAG